MRHHRRPVVWCAISQSHRDSAFRHRTEWGGHRAPERARGTLKEPLKNLVEAAHAPEPRGEGNLRHRKTRLLNQLLCKEHAAGLRDRNRGGAEVLLEQPSELPPADAEAFGEGLHPAFAVEVSFGDEREPSRDRIRGPAPGTEVEHRLRAASETRTEACFVSRGGRRIESTVLQLWRACGAYRP